MDLSDHAAANQSQTQGSRQLSSPLFARTATTSRRSYRKVVGRRARRSTDSRTEHRDPTRGRLWGGEPVASTRVFVDDAVLGHLPPVCVKDGIPTSDSLVLTENVGGRTGLGIAWLLLLVGPLGWLGLLILSASRQSGDILTVTLPYSEVAFT